MSEQRVCRPVASTDHTNGPLAALIKALSSGTHQGGHFTSNKDERFTAQLCSALNLQSNSLYANMQRGRAAASPKVLLKTILADSLWQSISHPQHSCSASLDFLKEIMFGQSCTLHDEVRGQ